MKDEIKEILDKFKRQIENDLDCILSPYQIKLLLDYITKLQQEKEDYKSKCEKAVEYLNSLTNYRFEFTFDSVDRHEIVGCEKNFVKDLLNILQGSDKE